MGESGVAEKINKLTVGLIKANLTEFSDIVKPNAEAIEIEAGTFYMERSRPRPPFMDKGFLWRCASR